MVLVHGTYANQYDSFARMAPELKWAGYCVYSFNCGTDGTDAAAQIPGVYGTSALSGNGTSSRPSPPPSASAPGPASSTWSAGPRAARSSRTC